MDSAVKMRAALNMLMTGGKKRGEQVGGTGRNRGAQSRVLRGWERDKGTAKRHPSQSMDIGEGFSAQKSELTPTVQLEVTNSLLNNEGC